MSVSESNKNRVRLVVREEREFVSLKALPENPTGKEVPHFFIKRGNLSGEILNAHVDLYLDERNHITTRNLVQPEASEAGIMAVSPQGVYIPNSEGKNLFAAPLLGSPQLQISVRSTSGSTLISANTSGSVIWALM